MSSGSIAEPVVAQPSAPTHPSVSATNRQGIDRPLELLIAEYCAMYGSSWKPATARKHRDDFRRLLDWLVETGRPTSTASLDFLTLAAYVTDLRARPRGHGVWRGSP